MKGNTILAIVLLLVLFNGYLFTKLLALENKVDATAALTATHDSKFQYVDKAVEVLEDCLEYNTFGECKQNYPQYQNQFR